MERKFRSASIGLVRVARGATRGKAAGEPRDSAEQPRNRDKRSRVGRADVEEQASHQTPERQHAYQTRDHYHGDEYNSSAVAAVAIETGDCGACPEACPWPRVD